MSVNVEALLREALVPIEPPDRLVSRLESMLVETLEAAQEELDSLELSSMRDPRNWVRPAAAALAAGTAGTALVVLRVRSHHRARVQESASLRDFAGRTLQDIADEARRILPDR